MSPFKQKLLIGYVLIVTFGDTLIESVTDSPSNDVAQWLLIMPFLLFIAFALVMGAIGVVMLFKRRYH